ncbi:hypothetical protein HDA35_003141 [Micromonospora purpureochromogenes]|uniref:Uncharacterized protein n=1 Tax=Micromonospora purpureochromogenes TaxID=47872 RepID=A0ABX2RMI7_9ACTN|nr:hypothetical protein [Micromonospora purpureochromogenes]
MCVIDPHEEMNHARHDGRRMRHLFRVVAACQLRASSRCAERARAGTSCDPLPCHEQAFRASRCGDLRPSKLALQGPSSSYAANCRYTARSSRAMPTAAVAQPARSVAVGWRGHQPPGAQAGGRGSLRRDRRRRYTWPWPTEMRPRTMTNSAKSASSNGWASAPAATRMRRS